MRRPARKAPFRLALALALAALASAAPHRAETAPAATTAAVPVPASARRGVTVSGVVTVKGQKTNANAVITLEAKGLVAKPPLEPFRIDQKGFRFIPHVLVVPTGSAIRFLNNDPEPHNVYSPEGRYNLGTWPTGDTRDHVFEEPGIYTQLCNVHPEMLAFVVVVDTPYFAVTDELGNYSIAGVRPGKYTLVAWHEKKDGFEREVVVEPGNPQKLDLLIER